MRTLELLLPMSVLLLAWPSRADDYAARMAAQQAEQARQSQQRMMSQQLEQQRLANQQYNRQLDNQHYNAALVQQHQQQTATQQAEVRDQLRRDGQRREQLVLQAARAAPEAQSRQQPQAGQRTTWVALGPNDSRVEVSGRNDFVATGVPEGLRAALANGRARNDALRTVSLGRRGEWALVRNEHEFDSHGLSREVRTAIEDDARRGDRLEVISFVGDAVVVVTNHDLFVSGSLPPALERALRTARRETGGVRSVAMSDDAWVVVDARGALHGSSATLAGAASDLQPARLVALGPRGDWVRVRE